VLMRPSSWLSRRPLRPDWPANVTAMRPAGKPPMWLRRFREPEHHWRGTRPDGQSGDESQPFAKRAAWAHSACTDLAEPDTDCEYDTAADDDLDDGVGELAAHEAIADESDCDEFTRHHRVSEL
jgi:hypothetical protein